MTYSSFAQVFDAIMNLEYLPLPISEKTELAQLDVLSMATPKDRSTMTVADASQLTAKEMLPDSYSRGSP